MQINDNAIVLNISHYSETSGILRMFSKEHGVMSGLVKGAFNKKTAGIIQPGNIISFTWQGKTAENLGSLYNLELVKNHFVMFSNDILRLYALQSACSICYQTLPEKQPYPQLYKGFCELLNSLAIDDFMAVYVFWEMGLLKTLGFEIDLSKCVVTNSVENLIYVSPKSAKAVSKEVGDEYKDKLLKLPCFFLDKSNPNQEDVIQGLKLTGYFLEKQVFNVVNKTTPKARDRFVNQFINNR